jgi:hypothetical protein
MLYERENAACRAPSFDLEGLSDGFSWSCGAEYGLAEPALRPAFGSPFSS